jgi:tetratricopeptide (TPR) repeat protein
MRLLPVLSLLAVLVGCGDSNDRPGDPDPAVDPAVVKEATALREQARSILREDPEQAIALLSSSIEVHPTAEAYLSRARAHLRQATMVMPGSMPPKVEADVEAALALDPDHLATLFFKAQRLGLGRPAGQEILARIAGLDVANDDGEGLFIRARAGAGLRDAEERSDRIRKDFGRAAELRPDDAEILLRWGSFLIRTVRDEEEATRVLSKAVEIDPDGGAGQAAKRLLDEM